MSIGMRILLGLGALLAATGAATAACPECDPDGGENPENTYYDLDVGAVEESTGTRALVDGDAATWHTDEDKGVWTWFTLCLDAFFGKIADVLGLDAGVDARAEVYADVDGVDVDGHVLGHDFDESAVGHLDDATWKHMATVHGGLARAGVDLHRAPVGTEAVETVLVDACVEAKAGPLPCE